VAEHTGIEWCDSTLNLQMGCDGCELWNPEAGVKHCYAGTLTERYGGKNAGFPESFDRPKLYLQRMDAALRWPDLTGRTRPDKPWLDGRPRVIFLNDMGDTFTESLPLDWLAPLLPRIADSPHLYLILTKRPKRMRDFAKVHPFPANVWPGASVTSQANAARVAELLCVGSGGVHWLSVEPLLAPVDLTSLKLSPRCECGGQPLCNAFDRAERCDCTEEGAESLAWHRLRFVIVGGESGPRSRPCRPEWIRSLLGQCRAAGVPAFCKQLGGNVVTRNDMIADDFNDGESGWPDPDVEYDIHGFREDYQGADCRVRLRDKKGGDVREWPADLRVRQFPTTKGQP
jgi:protein gp37